MPRARSLLGMLLAAGVIVAAEPGKPDAPADVSRLLDKLGSDKMDEQMDAARELGQLGAGARQAVPALRRLLADKNAWLRARAAIALLKIDQEHCKEAMAALAGQFADERNGACILVLEIGKLRVTSKEAVAGFLKLAHHMHPRGRRT